MSRKYILFIGIFLSIAFFFSSPSYAKIGVGIGTGKIVVDEKLRPGIIYELPSITVINTGDEALDYELGVEYHEKQSQFAPSRDWFSFSPHQFYLEPNKTQLVEIKLDLPLKLQPGDYFAYLEARPLKKSESNDTRIGVAAASKLYFTVVPGSPIHAVYYKLQSLMRIYAPWPQRIITVVGIVVAVLILKRFLHIEVGVKKPRDGTPSSETKHE